MKAQKVNKKILGSIERLLEISTNKHSKVMTVRFDIRFPQDYGGDTSNKAIRKCMAKIDQNLSREGLDPKYIWVREQCNSMQPHYHCAVLLNGHKSQNPYKVFTSAERLWKSTIGSQQYGLIHHCNVSKNGCPHENGIMLRKDHADYQSRLEDVRRQLSYLAKAEGKGQPLDGVRDFGMSRLK